MTHLDQGAGSALAKTTTPPVPAAPAGDLPYNRPYWDQDEIAAVTATLATGNWTNGGQVDRFEKALEDLTGAPVVCLSSGTTAIFALLMVLGQRVTGPKLLVTPTLNFVAGPAAARLLGWDVAFCDIDRDDLTLSATSLDELLERVGHRYAKVVVLPVHYAGHTADTGRILQACQRHGADLVEDACHAIGARYQDGATPVGSWPGSTAAYFSFHPTKPVASPEGGAVASHDRDLLAALRRLRNHNMVPAGDGDDHSPWPYDIPQPGLNLRLSDLHAAIGVVQVARSAESRAQRARLAARYHRALDELPAVRAVPPARREGSAHHLFPVVFDLAKLGITKRELIRHFHDRRIRCQVHYTPLHRLGAFADVPASLRTSLEVADAVFPGLLTLPLWRGMTDQDCDRVVDAIAELTADARTRAAG